MVTNTESCRDRLQGLTFAHRSCTRCGLHRVRGQLVGGVGVPDASIVVVLDRLSPKANTTGHPTSGGEGRALMDIVRQTEREVPGETFWFTAVTLCQPQPADTPFGAAEVSPVATVAEWRACQDRLHEELYIISPRVIIACGATSWRALLAKNTDPPSIVSAPGRITEAALRGRLTSYRVPVMRTHSMHRLFRNGEDVPLWQKCLQHFREAAEVSQQMSEREKNHVKFQERSPAPN
jgi:uracil-DNA glycosylase family 4